MVIVEALHATPSKFVCAGSCLPNQFGTDQSAFTPASPHQKMRG